MKIPRTSWFLAVSVSVLTALVSAPSNATSFAVGVVRPGGDRPCTLFQLVGVTQADPVVPGSPWFVLEASAPGYKEMVATLLAAKASGRNIQVEMTGTASAACGHPVVSALYWP